MDPGFRRDDKWEWIPAFAGMTTGSTPLSFADDRKTSGTAASKAAGISISIRNTPHRHMAGAESQAY